MELGALSTSLAVKDINASKAFYEKLGFTPFMGDGKSWQMLRNGPHVIGLFHGMFDRNTMTFNPGWDQNAQTVAGFSDVRQIQKALKAQGLALAMEADENSSGPASIMLIDPDGNPILIDQHV